MGATGTGKSRLSIHLASNFSGEVVNSDIIQVYQGLDIVTNKVTVAERRGIPHHLIGIVNPNEDFKKSFEKFVQMASSAIESVIEKRKLPIIAGGLNSFIESIIAGGSNLFIESSLVNDEKHHFTFRYDVCLLRVDVAMPVLKQYLYNRVDCMVNLWMVDEVRRIYYPHADYSIGIRRAIGVRELASYFHAESSSSANEETCAILLQKAIDKTKLKTLKLARSQIKKIHRIKEADRGWTFHRIHATNVFEKLTGHEAEDAWEEFVVGPASQIVSDFLHKEITEGEMGPAKAA